MSSSTASAPAQQGGGTKRKKREAPTAERSCRGLYCLRGTASCALEGCVVCAYKLCLHSDPERPLPPAERPERCLRVLRGDGSGGGDCAAVFGGLRVLTVGDGDCSFSAALAAGGRCAALDASTLAADEAALRGLYEGLDVGRHVAAIEAAPNARLVYGVDATDLLASPRLGCVGAGAYDRVVFNFPCIAVAGGQDGQNPDSRVADEAALEANRDLVRKFARSAATVVRPGGEVFVTHKTKPPFSWWGFPDLFADATSSFRFAGSFVFDRAAFPPYANRKACDKASFAANDAVTYVFRALAPAPASSSPPPPSLPSLPPPQAEDGDAATPFHRGPLPPRAATGDGRNGAFEKVDAALLARVRDAARSRASSKRPKKKKFEPR